MRGHTPPNVREISLTKISAKRWLGNFISPALSWDREPKPSISGTNDLGRWSYLTPGRKNFIPSPQESATSPCLDRPLGSLTKRKPWFATQHLWSLSRKTRVANDHITSYHSDIHLITNLFHFGLLLFISNWRWQLANSTQGHMGEKTPNSTFVTQDQCSQLHLPSISRYVKVRTLQSVLPKCARIYIKPQIGIL